MKRLFRSVSFNGKMTEWQTRVVTFFVGAAGYGCVELIWRGYTHPSMVLTGGACLLLIRRINVRFSGKPIFFRCIVCSAVITYVEFWVGCIVNRIMGLGVWDYSDMKMNFLGQVCLEYSVLWAALCLPILLVFSASRQDGAAKYMRFESERKKELRYKYKKTLFFLSGLW